MKAPKQKEQETRKQQDSQDATPQKHVMPDNLHDSDLADEFEMAQNRQKWYLLPLVISALTAIVSIRLLVPEHGGIGASWGMIISHGLLFVTLASINFRNFNLLLGQTWLGCIPAFLVMALVVSRFSATPLVTR